MRTALVFLVIALFACAFAKVRYDNHKVVRWSLKNETEFQLASRLASKLNLDVWASNKVEGWMDVMLSPTMTQITFPFPSTVQIPDVQATLDEEDAIRAALKHKRQDDFFSDFQTYGTILDWITQQAQRQPGKASTTVIGQTYYGNNIYGLRLGAGAGKRAIVIQCGIHAREWITPATCCWMIDQLLNQDSDGDRLLSLFEWLIIPSLNIDGYDYTHTTDRLWRKNRQPNSGSSCVGTDLNRNYDYAWSGPGASGNPCSETFYGSAPFSGPEAAAIRNTLQGYIGAGRLASYWDIHAYGALWMSPWGYTSNLPSDYAAMNSAMQAATDAVYDVNGRTYRYGSVYRTIYQTSGGSNDWSYGDGGCIHSYAVETFGNSFTPAPSTIPVIGAEVYAGVKATALHIAAKQQ